MYSSVALSTFLQNSFYLAKLKLCALKHSFSTFLTLHPQLSLWKTTVLLSFLLFVFILTQGHFFRCFQRKRKGEIHQCVSEALIGCFSCACQAPGSEDQTCNPGMCTEREWSPPPFVLPGQCSTQLSHTGQGAPCYFLPLYMCPLQVPHISEIIQCLSFSDQLLSLKICPCCLICQNVLLFKC